jgi:hypothetical protein
LIALIAEGASVTAGAKCNTLSEGLTQEMPCLQEPTTEETDLKREIGGGIIELPARIQHPMGK